MGTGYSFLGAKAAGIWKWPLMSRSWDSLVDIVTGLRTGAPRELVLQSWQRQASFLFAASRLTLRTNRHPIYWVQGAILGRGGKVAGCLKLTTHLHLVPRLRMSGAISPVPYMVIKCCLRVRSIIISCVIRRTIIIYLRFGTNIKLGISPFGNVVDWGKTRV
jgi:hypothetical protein